VQVLKTYGLTVSDDFLRHLERASVRFNNGGSGSFVSPRGLLFTNHHVGMDCIQKLSSADHDFSAATEAGEKACPDLEVDALLSTSQEPFQLPPAWIEAKPSLDLNTPFDFATTADTHGGNSGSPTVNTKRELIGILFDGNLEDIPNRYHADRVLKEIGF
jgi:hypothetical protein